MMEREDAGLPKEQGSETLPEALPLEQQVAELKASLEEAEREKGQFKALLQRVQADFANYRKRVDSERDEQQRYANGRLLLKLVASVDDLARALEHAPASGPEASGSWAQGVRLMHRNLTAILESEGVSTIEAQGQPFDPSAHEAVLLQESTEAPEGTVLAVARAGYRLHDRILQPAQVVVARRPQTQQSDSPEERGQKENSNG